MLMGVISKIKQNSSDMNEIILAPCDAGYVQNCTGLFMFWALARVRFRAATIVSCNNKNIFMVYLQNYFNCSTLVKKYFFSFSNANCEIDHLSTISSGRANTLRAT
jgi:hypothetical protein